MSTRVRSALAALALGVATLAATSPAVASSHDRFVVDTQFYGGPSSVVDTSGLFAGCTLARDLFGTAEIEGELVRFLGVKRLTCGGATTVLLEYDVLFDPDTGTTAGTWHVTSSTLEGVAVGAGGGLVGDPAGCTVRSFAHGCMLDTFTLAG
jgi:hypothetical protein